MGRVVNGVEVCPIHGTPNAAWRVVNRHGEEGVRYSCRACRSERYAQLPPEVKKRKQVYESLRRRYHLENNTDEAKRIREMQAKRKRERKAVDPEYRERVLDAQRRSYANLKKDPKWVCAYRARKREQYRRARANKLGIPYVPIEVMLSLTEVKRRIGPLGRLAIGKWAHVMPDPDYGGY